MKKTASILLMILAVLMALRSPGHAQGLGDAKLIRQYKDLSGAEKEKLKKMAEERGDSLSGDEADDKKDILNAPKLPEERGKPTSSSRIEKIISGDFPTTISRGLTQYGYEFFEKGGPAFTPLRDIPVGADYIIGPGDEIKVVMWGRLEDTFEIEVDSEGVLYIPEIGSMSVAGMGFGELKDLVKQKVEAITGVNASVSMGRLRTIDVFIVGEAKYPATYSVSSLSTVISALYVSGGPSKNGSLRNIKVHRNGTVVTLDLYDFFTKGIKKNDIRLMAGDTIFIPVLGPVAGVAGAVKRPAVYEMKGRQTIGEIIELAGGILPTGELQNVVVERIEGQKHRVIRSFNLTATDTLANKNMQLPLRDFDVVKIYPIHKGMERVVYLEGHVKYPREYELKPGMTILDILPSYDYLLPEPYLPRAEIIRQVPPDFHPEIIQFNLGALMAGDKAEDVKLKNKDRVIIYGMAEKEDIPRVTVEGAVREPGGYRLYQGMTVKELLFRAGNLTENAYDTKATLTRFVAGVNDTEVMEIDFSPKKAMAGLSPDNIRLQRDDSVRIRKIPQYTQALAQKVYLEGEFVFPGEYAFAQGERLSSIIEKAGGLTQHAYAFGASFHRESVKSVQEKRLKEYISKLEEDILIMASQEAAGAVEDEDADILKQTILSRKNLIQKLKTAQATGRMVIHLNNLLADPGSDADFELRAGDRLVVGKRPDSVNVLGEVYNPTAVFAEKERTVNYYLNAVGGVTPNGDQKQIYVVKADGSVISKTQESFFGMTTWDSGNNRWVMGFESTLMDPGDTIVVPKKMAFYPWMKVTRDVTQILYQIAVGAGVIVAAF